MNSYRHTFWNWNCLPPPSSFPSFWVEFGHLLLLGVHVPPLSLVSKPDDSKCSSLQVTGKTDLLPGRLSSIHPLWCHFRWPLTASLSVFVQWLGVPRCCSGKESGDMGLILGLGRSPGEGNGNSLQYSCLKNSMDSGAWRATVHGVTKSQTWLTEHAHLLSMTESLSIQGSSEALINLSVCKHLLCYINCFPRICPHITGQSLSQGLASPDFIFLTNLVFFFPLLSPISEEP